MTEQRPSIGRIVVEMKKLLLLLTLLLAPMAHATGFFPGGTAYMQQVTTTSWDFWAVFSVYERNPTNWCLGPNKVPPAGVDLVSPFLGPRFTFTHQPAAVFFTPGADWTAPQTLDFGAQGCALPTQMVLVTPMQSTREKFFLWMLGQESTTWPTYLGRVYIPVGGQVTIEGLCTSPQIWCGAFLVTGFAGNDYYEWRMDIEQVWSPPSGCHPECPMLEKNVSAWSQVKGLYR